MGAHAAHDCHQLCSAPASASWNESPEQDPTCIQEVIVTADYDKKGNEHLIACSYPKIADDLKPGSQILCADGSLVLRVEDCKPAERTVRCTAVNTAAIGCGASQQCCLCCGLCCRIT
jgi:Pyruvate kinase, barrel domain